ncbi:MAG TPA: 50S ribosomal protein L11 methyltransferase [Paludibaculum sp.]
MSKFGAAPWLAIVVCGLGGSCTSQPGMGFGAGLDVPYIQTPAPVVRAMLELAQVKPGELVIDLGCGDGRMAIAAATDFGARSIGYDLDPRRVAESRENARRAGVSDRAHFEVRDVLAADISQANVVVMYLIPLLIETLTPRLLSELGEGTRVVSHSFPIRQWTPERTTVVEGRTLYLYRVPKRAQLRLR